MLDDEPKGRADALVAKTGPNGYADRLDALLTRDDSLDIFRRAFLHEEGVYGFEEELYVLNAAYMAFSGDMVAEEVFKPPLALGNRGHG
ncbi:hypothetical protein CDD83_497 [Cordyceps sp. RAO-2017]|nr:hypothetical protein CDD83_497 [Cordyceps sp. RAO-2017]